MPNQQIRNFSSQNRRNFTSNRMNNKVDSILRLSNALQRDVNRITGQYTNPNSRHNMDLNAKLDVISENLMELRDKLESCARLQPQPSIQIPTTHPIQQPIPYTYPMLQRFLY